MSSETISASLSARLDVADTPSEVRQVLAETLILPRTHPEAVALGVIEDRAFRYLRRVTETTPDVAVAVLQFDLMPRCLIHDGSGYDDPWPSYGEILGDWLKEIPLREHLEVRKAAISSVIVAIKRDNIPGALRLAAYAGYADPIVCRSLEELISVRDDELGDRALMVRVVLGTSPESRKQLRESLHTRLHARTTYRLFDVARRIGDESTISVLMQSWLASPVGPDRPQIDDMFALSALATIATRSNISSVASDLWHRIHAIATAQPERKLFHALDSGVIAKISTPHVIADIVTRLPRGDGVRRWFYYNRLLECAMPIQTDGWDAVEPETLGVVQSDATATVDIHGEFRTTELDQKEDAWEVLLCVGRSAILPSIDRAVQANTSGHAKHIFLELAACLGVSPLPTDVPILLNRNLAVESWTTDEILIAQVGAVRAAHAAMSDVAFHALLEYSPVRDGILISVLDALAELAAVAARNGDRTRIEKLMSLALRNDGSTACSAGAAAIAKLLQDLILTDAEVKILADLASKDGIDPFTRRAILNAFASRPEVPITPVLLSAAEGLAFSAKSLSSEEQRAGLSSSGLLLFLSRLQGDALRKVQTERLGFLETDGRISLIKKDGSIPNSTMHSLAQWYTADPVRYEPAVLALLGTGDPLRLAPVLRAVHQIGKQNSKLVIDALMVRAHDMDSGSQAEPFVLELLADIAPSSLVNDDWPQLSRWIPEARAAMATALSRIRDPANEVGCEKLLIRLMGDGTYGIRRTAYSNYAKANADNFLALVASWAAASDETGVELRQRAAESVVWSTSELGFTTLQPLEWDPDPTVREAFGRAMDERRRAEWAEFHLSKVLSANETGDVVRYWRHGVALKQLGNDHTIEELRRRARDPLPPNIRFWLERIRKGVQKTWDDVTRNWPDPWFNRPGRHEVVEGTIKVPEGSETPVRAHLWFAAAERPDGYHNWGGWAEIKPFDSSEVSKRPKLRLSSEDDHKLHILGRRSANILITRSFPPYGPIVFSGNGPYPSITDSELEE